MKRFFIVWLFFFILFILVVVIVNIFGVLIVFRVVVIVLKDICDRLISILSWFILSMISLNIK